MKQHGQQTPTAIAESNTDTAETATQSTEGPDSIPMERSGSVAATPTRSSEETDPSADTQLAEGEDETQPLLV